VCISWTDSKVFDIYVILTHSYMFRQSTAFIREPKQMIET